MASELARARTTARERQREDTRQRVFEAALLIFRRDGIVSARIQDITQEAGVSHGTFYFHFPTKDDVLLELLRLSQEEVVQKVEALPGDTPLPAVLEVVGECIAQHWQGDAGLFPAAGALALRTMASPIAVRDTNDVRASLQRRFQVAAERGELSKLLPPEVLADIYLINIFAAVMGWCASPVLPLNHVVSGVSILFMNGAKGGV